MTKWTIIIASILVICGRAFPQNPPQLYTINDNIAEWNKEGKSFDGVWNATLKSLMQMKWKIETSDKASGTISTRKPAPKFNIGDIKPNETATADITIIADDNSIMLMARHYYGLQNAPGGAKKQAKKFYEEFFSNLEKNLK